MLRLLRDLTYFIFGLIEGLLVFRFVLKLFGASASAPVVEWIYETSQPLLSPFLAAFPAPKVSGFLVVEFSTLFAVFTYAFVGYIVQEILEAMASTSSRRRD